MKKKAIIVRNPVGRPTVVTPEILTKLEYAFSIDSTVGEACSFAEISQKVFYEYLKRNPEFSERIVNFENSRL